MRPLNLRRFAVFGVGLVLATEVLAQWAWKDDNGRLVFSDRPPPSSVKPEQLVRQPGRSGAQPALGGNEVPPREPGKADSAKAGPRTPAEQEMEFRKRQTERAEAQVRLAEQQQQEQRRQQECERSRGYLRSLEDGVRIARTDPQGNRQFLDDAQRAAELTRVREIVARDCSSN